MALFGGIAAKISSQFSRKINQAIYQYWVSSGVANEMPDNFDAYLEKGYATNADVYSIISRIDAMRKQATLCLRKKLPDGSSEEVKEHELLRFKEKVNEDLSTDDFISQFLIYRLVLGNFFAYHPTTKNGLNAGKPTYIYPMPVNEVEIIEGDWMSPVKGYKLEGSQNPFFEKFEVYHSKMFNPLYMNEQSLYGMSPMKAAARIVSKSNEGEITQLKQFENQGAPYILTKKAGGNERLTDPQRTQITKQVKNASKPENRGLPLILKDEYNVLNLGQTIADLNIIESSKDGRRVLAGVWQFPPVLIGVDDATFNNMSEARKSAWTDCLKPNLKIVANAMNAITIESYEPYKAEGLYWSFDYSNIEELQGGMKEKVEWMKLAKYTPNEIRVATGGTPFDDSMMDQPIYSTNEMPLSDLSLPDETEGKKDFKDYQ